MTNASEDVTRLLVQWSGGDREALDRLVPFIYDALHRIAERQFRHERAGSTLQPTPLLTELYLRLIKQTGMNWRTIHSCSASPRPPCDEYPELHQRKLLAGGL